MSERAKNTPVKKRAKPAATKSAAGAKARARRPANPFKVNAKSWNREKVMDVVCNAIASSSKSVATILDAGHDGHALPDYATFARWMSEVDGDGGNAFRDMYARAKEAQAEFMAEELAELHNKAWVPALHPETGMPIMVAGKPIMVVDKSSAALVRLEADNKKWLMAKLKPKRFGDKVTQEVSGPGGGPIQARIAVEFVRPVPRDEDEES